MMKKGPRNRPSGFQALMTLPPSPPQPRAGPGIQLPGLISTAFAPGLRGEIYLHFPYVRTYVILCFEAFLLPRRLPG